MFITYQTDLSELNNPTWKQTIPIQNENIVEKITAKDIVRWYIPRIFPSIKPKGMIYSSKVEKIKDLARYLDFNPKDAEKLIEEYWKEKEDEILK
jgi:hypothetical protein